MAFKVKSKDGERVFQVTGGRVYQADGTANAKALKRSRQGGWRNIKSWGGLPWQSCG